MRRYETVALYIVIFPLFEAAVRTNTVVEQAVDLGRGLAMKRVKDERNQGVT